MSRNTSVWFLPQPDRPIFHHPTSTRLYPHPFLHRHPHPLWPSHLGGVDKICSMTTLFHPYHIHHPPHPHPSSHPHLKPHSSTHPTLTLFHPLSSNHSTLTLCDTHSLEVSTSFFELRVAMFTPPSLFFTLPPPFLYPHHPPRHSHFGGVDEFPELRVAVVLQRLVELQNRMVQGRTQVKVHRKTPDPVPAGKHVELNVCVKFLHSLWIKYLLYN